MSWVGFLLILSGLLLVLVGIVILGLGAVQLLRQMGIFRRGAAGGAALPAAPGVNLGDLTKLIEAIIKMPQWLLAVLAGDLQIWLGYLIDKHNIFTGLFGSS
jgi:hypothetical protein